MLIFVCRSINIRNTFTIYNFGLSNICVRNHNVLCICNMYIQSYFLSMHFALFLITIDQKQNSRYYIEQKESINKYKRWLYNRWLSMSCYDTYNNHVFLLQNRIIIYYKTYTHVFLASTLYFFFLSRKL